jgi:C4-type Zn-finger protein
MIKKTKYAQSWIDLIEAVCEKHWICPLCFSKMVVKQWLTQVNQKGDVVNELEQMEDPEYHCRNCGFDFDQFIPINDWKGYPNKGIIGVKE